jgi:hypothetical protein
MWKEHATHYNCIISLELRDAQPMLPLTPPKASQGRQSLLNSQWKTHRPFDQIWIGIASKRTFTCYGKTCGFL